MNITEKHIKIFNAELCPYCNSITKRITETDVYGKEYSGRDIIACINYPNCEAYVGCNDDGKPLGRLANKKLRRAKIDAHAVFDELWKSNKMKRNVCYKELSEDLGIPPQYTHIGMFGEVTLKKVIIWSKTKMSGLC